MSEKRILVLRQNLALSKPQISPCTYYSYSCRLFWPDFCKNLTAWGDFYPQFFLSAKDTFQRPPATRLPGIFSNFPLPQKYRKCRFGYRRRKFFVSGFTYLLRMTLRFCQTDKEKSSKSFSDLLLSLAADGRWIFSFESSGQVGPMMDSTINSCFPFKALCIFSISLDDYFFHNQSMYLNRVH